MNHSEIVSFLWGVADLIRDTFKRGKYQDVILPLTVLRRLDCVLAPTKERVLGKQAELRGKKLENLDPHQKERSHVSACGSRSDNRAARNVSRSCYHRRSSQCAACARLAARWAMGVDVVSEVRTKERATGLRRFKRYPAYKDSGVEWLGDIPVHWEVKRLKYVAPVTDERSRAMASDLPYVGLEHIESLTGQLARTSDNTNPNGDEAEGATSLFRPGDVLFGKLRPYLAKVLRPRFEGRCSTELLVLRSGGAIAPAALAYQLLSRDFIGWVNAMTYGTKMPRANPDQVMEIPIALTSTLEQGAITAFLDRETARIDALLAKKERLIELLQEERTALITRAVTKGLNPNIPMKDSGVEWLGEIPAHWHVKKIKRLCLVRRGASPRPIDDPIYFNDGGEYAWVRIADVTASNRYLEKTTQRLSDLGKSRSVTLEPGELFVSIAATVGKPVITKIKCCIHDGFVYFVGLRENREYLYYLFSCGELYKGLGKLGTQLNLNTDTIGDMYLPRPPRIEQQEIVTFLDSESSRIETLVAKVGDAIDRLKELRTALISAAVTGKIDVREEVA